MCTVSWAWDVVFACSLALNLRLVAGAGVWFAVTGFQNSVRNGTGLRSELHLCAAPWATAAGRL